MSGKGGWGLSYSPPIKKMDNSFKEFEEKSKNVDWREQDMSEFTEPLNIHTENNAEFPDLIVLRSDPARRLNAIQPIYFDVVDTELNTEPSESLNKAAQEWLTELEQRQIQRNSTNNEV